MLFAIYLAMTGLFVLLGVVFAAGKGTGLIAGYNTASAEEKRKLRQKEALQGHVTADVCAGRLLAGYCVKRDFQENRLAVDRAGAVSYCQCCRGRVC